MKLRQIDQHVWLQHNWINRLQSACLLMVMALFFALLGWLLWGVDGVIIVLLAGIAGVVMNSMISPRMVMYLYGARMIKPSQMPALWRVLVQITEQAKIPALPQLYYVPSSMLNAFAVGTQSDAAIVLTDGLIRALSLREIAGVMAHEVSHIRNNDLWVMGLADMFSRMTSLMSWFGQVLLLINLPLILVSELSINWLAIVLLIFAPNLSALAQLALSRTREYNADLNAAQLTGDPDGLAGALVKIEHMQGGWLERVLLPGRRVPVPSILRTHPETGERVRRLMQIKPKRTVPDWIRDSDNVDLRSELGRPVERRPRWHVSGLWH